MFRSRKEVEQQQRDEDRQRTELEHMLVMNRKRAMRELHQKRLQTIEILPPGNTHTPVCAVVTLQIQDNYKKIHYLRVR